MNAIRSFQKMREHGFDLRTLKIGLWEDGDTYHGDYQCNHCNGTRNVRVDADLIVEHPALFCPYCFHKARVDHTLLAIITSEADMVTRALEHPLWDQEATLANMEKLLWDTRKAKGACGIRYISEWATPIYEQLQARYDQHIKDNADKLRGLLEEQAFNALNMPHLKGPLAALWQESRQHFREALKNDPRKLIVFLEGELDVVDVQWRTVNRLLENLYLNDGNLVVLPMIYGNLTRMSLYALSEEDVDLEHLQIMSTLMKDGGVYQKPQVAHEAALRI